MEKIIKPHPAVAEYDRVYRSMINDAYRMNSMWWSGWVQQRLIQIASNHKMSPPELENMWMEWLQESNQTR